MSALAATRVVIADDSALMRSMLSSALREAGIDVVGQAANGDEALRLCDQLRPDVLSLDLAMPGRDGLAVLRELRAREVPDFRSSSFPRSRAAAGARAVDALAEGAFDLVAKPSSRGELGSFTNELVERVELARVARRRKVHANPAVASRARTPGTFARRSERRAPAARESW